MRKPGLLWLVALVGCSTMAAAEDPPVSATEVELLKYKSSPYVWHDIRLGNGRMDLFERTFPRTTQLTSQWDCAKFDCYLQNDDTRRVVEFPREERVWASATGHSRTAPCGAGDDLVSVFERYDGCEPLLRPVDHATVTLPRDPLQTRLNEKKDETANPELDDRPAVPADGVERGGRGTAAQRERGARH